MHFGEREEQRRKALAALATMPNSAACLIAFAVSRPALARPIDLRAEDCACSRKEEKSWRASGWRTEPTTLPPFDLTKFEVCSSSE